MDCHFCTGVWNACHSHWYVELVNSVLSQFLIQVCLSSVFQYRGIVIDVA